jgi:putative lipoic acid-binding regulatory protein
LWEFANTKLTPPTDPKDLVAHELKDVKSKRIILDVVKDHLIPHISEKKSSKDMFVALTNLFQSNNTNRKMVLRENLKDTKMTKLDIMTSYLTKITQVCDQLEVVGEVVSDEELVRMTLNGFSKPWAHSSRESLHGRNFYILTSYGMISSRRIFGRNL